MAAPTPYDRQYNFSNYQAATPSDPLPGNKVDQELNAVKNSLDETQANLALIQRDDGQLKNNSVGLDQLKTEVEIGVNPPTAWVTLQNYTLNETVTFEAGFYRCIVAHISGTFATDLAAAKWQLIVDFGDAISSTAIATALHEALNKTAPVDDDEFLGNDSADSYTIRRFKWSNIKAYMVAGIGAILNSTTAKTTPVDADNLLLGDSAASNATKKITWANVKAGVYAALGSTVAALTGKTTPADGDTFAISDSAASDAAKKLTWANLKATMFAALGSLLASGTSKTTPVDADSVLLSDSAASDATKKLTIANLKTAIGGSVTDAERRNALLRFATLAKLAAGFQRDINAFAAGFKGASDAADGIYSVGSQTSAGFTRDSSAGCVKPTLGSATLIPQATGTATGTMTGGGGVAAAFDSNSAQSAANSARATGQSGHVGKRWSGTKNVSRYKVVSPNTEYSFADSNSGNNITLTLKGSNDTTNGTDGTWTTLHTDTFANGTSANVSITKDYTSGITAGDYAAHRVEILFAGGVGNVFIAEAEFYEAASVDSTVQFLQQTVDSTGRIFGVADVHPVEAMTIGTTYLVEVYTGGSWVACDLVNAGVGESGRTIVGFSKSGMTPSTTVDLRIRTVGKDHRTYRFGYDARNAA